MEFRHQCDFDPSRRAPPPQAASHAGRRRGFQAQRQAGGDELNLIANAGQRLVGEALRVAKPPAERGGGNEPEPELL